MRRVLSLIAVTVIGLTLAGCALGSDPFVGSWQQVDGARTMTLNVAPSEGGRYTVNWVRGPQSGPMRLDVYQKSDGTYTDFAGDVFSIAGEGALHVRFTDALGKKFQARFGRPDTSRDEDAWEPD